MSPRSRSEGRHWTWWSGMLLGCLLVAAGIAETVRAVRSGDGGIPFWFGTLVGGGALVLAGTLVSARRPTHGFVLTTIGCVVGLVPTMWTVIVPVLLVTQAVATARQSAAATANEANAGSPRH